jgi:retron-type reverse transcriptase
VLCGRCGGGDLRQGYRIAVDIDPAKFFDTVDFDLPMHHVGTKVRDKWVLALIGKYLRAGVKVEYRLRTLSTNQWLKDQGLVSVKELWVKTHYPATAR